jgi:hypothetical protein
MWCKSEELFIVVVPVMGCGKGGRGPAFHNLTGVSGGPVKLAQLRPLRNSP